MPLIPNEPAFAQGDRLRGHRLNEMSLFEPLLRESVTLKP